MRKLVGILAIAFVLAALPACSSSGSSATRTVHLDYNSDQFASSMFAFSPSTLSVHPGDTLDFRQAWTGEAHTITFGSLNKELGDAIKPYFDGTKEIPQDEPPELMAAEQKLPEFFGDNGVNQTAAQPCFLDAGPLPSDGKPCPKRAQPKFNGRQAWYSSGFVRYGGNDGNKYEMPIAADATPGTYYFYCLLHGAGMSGYLTIKPKGESVDSQSALNAAARKRQDSFQKLLAKGDAQAKKAPDKPAGVDILAGADAAMDPKQLLFGSVLEFYPKVFTAKVGQKVSWMVNGHTVSFDVPKYVPVMFVDKDGTVRPNPKTTDAVNAPSPPPGPGGGPNDSGPPPPPTKIDAGNYDGSKFLSSGSQDNEIFSITFTKPGTYQYACLVHPRMVGTLIVK